MSVIDLESGEGVEIWNFFLNKKLFKMKEYASLENVHTESFKFGGGL